MASVARVSDLLIRNARLVPVHAGETRTGPPVDVLVQDGRVTEVGRGRRGLPGVEEVDAEGRWLIPGLWDQHVHLGQWTLAAPAARPGRGRSAEEAAVALVAERLAERPDEPVIGWGHRPAAGPASRTVAELDAVATEVRRSS